MHNAARYALAEPMYYFTSLIHQDVAVRLQALLCLLGSVYSMLMER
jgi:hypothetical protein